MHATETQYLAHRLDFGDIALDGPELGVRWPIGGATAELIERDHAVAVIDQAGMGLAQIVARQAWPAVEAENRLVALAEAVSDDLEPVDLDFAPLVRRQLTPHAHSPP